MRRELTKAAGLFCLVGSCCLIACAVPAGEESNCGSISQSLGIDQRVDYRSLTKYGPWDDRNYELTAEDLQYLAPNEEELRDPIPAFFRVELRKEMPHLRRSGPAQYPRSALQLFEIRYGGLKRGSGSKRHSVEPDADGRSDPCRIAGDDLDAS